MIKRTKKPFILLKATKDGLFEVRGGVPIMTRKGLFRKWDYDTLYSQKIFYVYHDTRLGQAQLSNGVYRIDDPVFNKNGLIDYGEIHLNKWSGELLDREVINILNEIMKNNQKES